MLLRKKLIKVGNSRAIIIPNIWLESHENKSGKEVVEVELLVNSDITITVPESPG